MSRKHPVIAVTGSSGAGTSTVKEAFQHICRIEDITPCIVEGDSFHRYNRVEMRKMIESALTKGINLSHFGLEANDLESLQKLFYDYGMSGGGKRRYYLHNSDEAEPYNQEPGTFTPWENVPEGTNLLLYEGLHGGVIDESINIAQHVDLLIGVVPIVNLEWIQKIHRDTNARGYHAKDVTETILRRMYDYTHYITPQFSNTDINFQRVPMVDTSNPFIATEIPTADESLVVIRFKNPAKFSIDFPYLLSMIHDSFMSRRNNIVVPGGKMTLAMELILTPIISKLVEKHKKLLKDENSRG